MFGKLSDNLNLLMAQTRVNASELARQTGVPASTIKKIRSHSDVNPTLATLIPLARKFSITVSQLVGDIELSTNHQSSPGYDFLPLLTWEEAATWPNICKTHTVFSRIKNWEYSKQSFALPIDEDNWEGFVKGSMIIIDPETTIEHRDFAIVHKAGMSVPSLRQILHDDGNIYLKPVVRDYKINLLTSQHQFIGAVVEIKKKLK